MESNKEYILRILKNQLGGAQDNLYRANAMFRNKTEQEMNERYGQSHETCREILDGYKETEQKIKECIDWISSL